MYSMCAERVEAAGGTTLLWHALDRNGDVLCARMAGGTAAWQPEAADDRDEYCGDCMDAVASAFRHGPDGTGAHVAPHAGVGAGAQAEGDGGGASWRGTDPAEPDRWGSPGAGGSAV
ncbi:hypothetical protein [Streptomyces pacificus]|uniref:Uncharacterized protein n=1 Tax=Streptomyces pacificus TaxID=2705029 RepID=A0A6A0AYS8_9ACTN|nr:hypothetical protein [Streptomyces pacificus]GFH38032.1 hypothetical protein SCWH03_42720 [Streptomyces pacificus]